MNHRYFIKLLRSDPIGFDRLVVLSPLPVTGASQAAVGATITVYTLRTEYNTSGSGSGCFLREAIRAADTNTAFGGCAQPVPVTT